MYHLFFILFVSWLSLFASAETITGQMYEQGSSKNKLLYNYSNSTSENTVKVEMTDPQGQTVVTESAQLNASQLIKYEITHQQLNAKAIIEVKDGRVYFTREMDGKKKTDDEKLGANLIVSANFSRFVKDNWSQLSQGEEIDIRYGVWDRMETVGFTLKKMAEESVDGTPSISIRMKPTSFVIAALVKPVFLNYSLDGTRLLKLNGRVLPKKKVGQSWKDLDAEAYYQHAN